PEFTVPARTLYLADGFPFETGHDGAAFCEPGDDHLAVNLSARGDSSESNISHTLRAALKNLVPGYPAGKPQLLRNQRERRERKSHNSAKKLHSHSILATLKAHPESSPAGRLFNRF